MNKSPTSFLILTLLLGFVIVSFSCGDDNKNIKRNKVFAEELNDLKNYFSIPGISAVISKNDEIIFEQYLGSASLDPSTKVDAATVFPIASITKLYTAVLTMKLVESKTLSLDATVNDYIQGLDFDEQIKVKHLLSHTSQGRIGEEFFYSSRFSLLTRILESASGKSFDQLMHDEIIEPLQLSCTFLLKDSLQLQEQKVKLAAPFFHPGNDQKGFVDFGYSASAGLTSTAKEIIVFNRALNANELISKESKTKLFNGLGTGLPYSYGLFKQHIEGLDVFWVYGQYDCYSSLYIKVPEKGLDLIVLANNNLMSDPARLIMGDLQSSLFANSFLKNYVFDGMELPLLEKDSVLYAQRTDEFYRRKVLAQALASSFLARYEPQQISICRNLLEQTFSSDPEFLEYADINLLHTLVFLKEVYFYKDLGEFNQFDQQIAQIGAYLLDKTPNDPYLHTYMGTYHDRNGEIALAAKHFNAILSLKNFSPNWYSREAEIWLRSHSENNNIK